MSRPGVGSDPFAAAMQRAGPQPRVRARSRVGPHTPIALRALRG
jgi:hypothetical protein